MGKWWLFKAYLKKAPANFWDCSLTSLTYVWPRSWPTFCQFYWFPDYNSRMEPARILILGILMHSTMVWLGIVHRLLWPILDLGHDLLSVSHIGFQTLIPGWNQLGSWSLLTDFSDLYFGLGHDLLCIILIGASQILFSQDCFKTRGTVFKSIAWICSALVFLLAL